MAARSGNGPETSVGTQPPRWMRARSGEVAAASDAKARLLSSADAEETVQRRVASAGCSASGRSRSIGTLTTWRPGRLEDGAFLWTEPGLPQVRRTFKLYVPRSRVPGRPMPLVVAFHGWNEQGFWYHDWGFGKVAEAHGFAIVYPQGLADCGAGQACEGHSSWNGVGSVSSSATRQACDPFHQHASHCYDSCQARSSRCHKCDWTTCYNDVGFVRELVDLLEDRLCLDRARVYAYGCSNGGMLTHGLAQRMPSRFAAIVAGCGAKPHAGWERDFRPGGAPIAMMLITGRSDQTIPRSRPSPNTSWWDGFRYASEKEVVAAYKEHDKCTNAEPRPWPTVYTANNMTCAEEGYNCAEGTDVVRCLFDGGHDINRGKGSDNIEDEPQIAWEFFSRHERTMVKSLATINAVSEGAVNFMILPTAVCASALCLVSIIFTFRAVRRAHRKASECAAPGESIERGEQRRPSTKALVVGASDEDRGGCEPSCPTLAMQL